MGYDGISGSWFQRALGLLTWKFTGLWFSAGEPDEEPEGGDEEGVEEVFIHG